MDEVGEVVAEAPNNIINIKNKEKDQGPKGNMPTASAPKNFVRRFEFGASPPPSMQVDPLRGSQNSLSKAG